MADIVSAIINEISGANEEPLQHDGDDRAELLGDRSSVGVAHLRDNQQIKQKILFFDLV